MVANYKALLSIFKTLECLDLWTLFSFIFHRGFRVHRKVGLSLILSLFDFISLNCYHSLTLQCGLNDAKQRGEKNHNLTTISYKKASTYQCLFFKKVATLYDKNSKKIHMKCIGFTFLSLNPCTSLGIGEMEYLDFRQMVIAKPQ